MTFTAFTSPNPPTLLYDGFEDGWFATPWSLPLPDGTTFEARFSRDARALEEINSWAGDEVLHTLAHAVRARVRDWSGHDDYSYQGYDGLPLYYVRHEQCVWVLAAGESQPQRYKTYLHGGWQLL